MKQAYLYERLGKVEGITALVDNLVDAHYVNPVIQHRFLILKPSLIHDVICLCRFAARLSD